MPASGPDHVTPAPGVPAAAAAASRVLLIEADASVALALLRGLRRHGWAVCWAATAQAGVKLQTHARQRDHGASPRGAAAPWSSAAGAGPGMVTHLGKQPQHCAQQASPPKRLMQDRLVRAEAAGVEPRADVA